MDMQTESSQLPKRLAEIFGVKQETVASYFREIQTNNEFYSQVESKVQDLKSEGVFAGTTSRLDSQTIYTVCRILQPETVIETGVRYGGFDAHITEALKRNNKGRLLAIDLPNAVEKFEYGYLIPEENTTRWELHLGDSRELLPELLCSQDSVDMFLHDSKHSRFHMKWEYTTAYPQISHGGVLASHDILRSNVFSRFANEWGMSNGAVRNVGVAVKN